MPWRESSSMDLRRRLIEDYLTDAWSVTELCSMYDVSRKSVYKWVGRFGENGWAGLADRSRRPHHAPHAVPTRVRDAIVAAHLKKPDWGPRKIRGWLLRRCPRERWPSRVTIATIWRQAGLRAAPRPRATVRPLVRRLTPATVPNTVWTIDFKGDFRLGDGTRCHPLTLRDLASRYALACVGLRACDRVATQRRLERAFAQYGLPDCIRSDNGTPFGGPGLQGLSQLGVWWLRLGIRVEHTRPGRPDDNGAHEQFHRVLKRATARPPAATLRRQQHRFDAFCQEYNDERPHEALSDAVPADRYRPSRRTYPGRLPPLEYPAHWETRRVQPNGRIPWHRGTIFLSRALAGQVVGLEEIDEALWTIHFAGMPLARWAARPQQLRAWDFE